MSFADANLPIQVFINNGFGDDDRSYEPIEYFKAVSAASPIELDPSSFLINPGRQRSVKLTYFPMICNVDGSCDANICDTGVVYEPEQIMFDITRCTASQVFRVNKNDIRLTDNNQWDFSAIGRILVARALPALRRELALDWITYAYELAGLHPDGLETHRISVTNPTNGVVNPIGLNDARREFTDNGLNEPYLLGGGEIYNWLSMVRIGGLNANGQRIDLMSTRNVWYDDGLTVIVKDDEANGDWILAIDPQVFKYVWYLDNAGIFGTTMASINDMNLLFQRGTETVLNGVLVDPVTRIPWDLDIYYSPCGKFWNFQLKHQWDFFVLPNDCLPQGVNGIWAYRTCPAVVAPCPTGDSPASPVTPTVFDWTPADVTFTLYRSTIDGRTTILDTPVVIASLADLNLYMNGASNITFVVNGSDIEYTGYSAIAATFETNQGTITASF